jgi:predicted dehydrogenase
MSNVRVALIGCGYWGPNLIRNFNEVDNAAMVACSDLSLDRLNRMQKRYPGIVCTQNYEDLLRDPSIDAVVIATPVSTHYPIARQALDYGKHVMIEKPIAGSSEQALDLIERAASKNRVLMVDHTFIYTSAVRKIRELIDTGEVGDILYFDSVRVNLGLFQRDINVVWDLAPHDLSIMD